MSALVALSWESGIPLFTRCSGLSPDKLSFAITGILRGMAYFSDKKSVELKSISSDGVKILYHLMRGGGGARDGERILLILVTKAVYLSNGELEMKLELMADALLFCYGWPRIDKLCSGGEEQFKREIRVAFSIIDYFLECSSLELLSNCREVAVLPFGPDPKLLQTWLDGFASLIETPYACLYADVLGRGDLQIISATSKWWAFVPRENLLLKSAALTILKRAGSADCPVYLPQCSVDVPFRLLMTELVAGIYILTICGVSPSFISFLSQTKTFWRPNLEGILKIRRELCYGVDAASQIEVPFEHVCPRRSVINNFIPVKMDGKCLCFFIICRGSQRCFLGVNWPVISDINCPIKAGEVVDGLKDFYRSVHEGDSNPEGDRFRILEGVRFGFVGSGDERDLGIFVAFTKEIPRFALIRATVAVANYVINEKSVRKALGISGNKSKMFRPVSVS